MLKRTAVFLNWVNYPKRLLVFGVLLLDVLLQPTPTAQTVTRRLAWDQPGATLADLPGLAYTLVIDAAAPIVLTPTCTFATVLSCVSPITLTQAPHTLTLTVTNAFGSATAPPLNGVAPIPSVNVKVVVTVTVP